MKATTEKDKLLFVGPYPPPFSGPEYAMKTLLESGLKDEFDIVFYNTNFRSSLDQKGRMDLNLLRAFFRFNYHLIQYIVKNRPKLVYYFVTATQMGWIGKDIWCILISKLLGRKVVIHMRAGHFRINYNNFNSIFKWIVRKTIGLVNLGIVQADVLKNQFSGLIPDDKIASIYNSIDIDKFFNPAPTVYDRNIIFYMGHLSFAKGYCDLLKALPLIASEFPEVVFCFAGTKLYKERNVHHNQVTGEQIEIESIDDVYDRHIKGKYEDHYRYLGIIDEPEKIEWFKRCNLFILPSYSEGFSMSVLEALAMSKPVVCTPVGALAEIVHDEAQGLIVNPGDISGFAEAIVTLMKNEEMRNKIAVNNGVYAREMFSINTIQSKLARLFRKVMGDNGSRHAS